MEQKDSEVIRENEERLRLGLQAGDLAGVWDWDIRTGKVIWSRGLEKIHGMAPGTFPGTVDAVLDEIHSEDRKAVSDSIQRVLEKKQEHRVQYRIVRQDGSVRWVQGAGHLYCDAAGNPERMVGLCIDINDQKLAEEAFRESDLKFRSVIESANDAIILADETGIILSCNPSTVRIFGYCEEIVGKPVTILMPERYREAHEAGIRRFLESGEPRLIGKTVEMHGVKPDGTEFPLELSLSSWKLGANTFFTAAIRDITRRRIAEAAAQQQSALVHMLQDVAVASNQAGSVESAIQFSLDRICKFTGWPVGHVYFPSTIHPEELHPSNLWHLEDPELYRNFKEITEKTVLRTGIGLPGRVLEQGETLWIPDVTADSSFPRARAHTDINIRAAIGLPVLVGTKVVAVLEFFSDSVDQPNTALLEAMHHIGTQLGRVFERQQALEILSQAELRYRQLVESVQAIVWSADANTLEFTFVSREAEVVLGYPVQEWTSNPTFWMDHIHPDDEDWALSFCKKSAADKKPYEFEHRMISRDGRVVWLRNFVNVLTKTETVSLLIGVMIDITREKQSEEKLNKSREQLRSLSAHLQSVREEERTKVAREIHDDLGQVLTALKMDLALLNRGMLETSAVVPRKELMEEIGSMCKLVDQTIKTVRRICTELRPEVLDHLDLKAAMEWQIQEFLTRSGVTCEFNSNIQSVSLDRDSATALFRIFQETLTNVARHSNASHVKILLEENDDKLTMEVSDNGRGITEENLANSKSFGLMGMKERAFLLGGEVNIVGVPGKGTTVTVRISLPNTV